MNASHKCNNIRSRHYPLESCKNKSLIGKEFCAKHIKNPHKFLKPDTSSVVKIQSLWKKYC